MADKKVETLRAIDAVIESVKVMNFQLRAFRRVIANAQNEREALQALGKACEAVEAMFDRADAMVAEGKKESQP